MLHYNENKVAAGEARLILANGFAGDIDKFNLEQKLQRFEYLTMLNTRVKTNAVHVTLNFDEQDKLSNEQLQQITLSYMEKIGFGDQPYLVYKHNDAAHTHVHIATVNIKPDGNRIDTHGIGWRLSEPARIALEKEYGLVQAQGRKNSNTLNIKAVNIEKAIYGKTPTKRAITNIVNAVINTYKFTSLAEFNLILQQFNVIAADSQPANIAETPKAEAVSQAEEAKPQAEPTKKEIKEQFLAQQERKLAETVKLVEALGKKIAQKNKLENTISNLDSFTVAQSDDKDDMASDSRFARCELVISDDDGNEFVTKNPFIIAYVAHEVKQLCIDKLAEVEASIIIPL
ncbi:relaxase/mobilization nuclease domain-containing protein [Mucilaginibacter sp. cycad4]|uniref:relaxase/mobilization nuclease domain-containing protein n=1 Tax=Mucilaginibacter sp. cycad4 TaxID=3342096 RepID=UPI002AAA8C0E|nr:relaxase/mobilization nuclease domain-containing protein [Mucilaginibacter gossypii]WPV01920.1 relaxase/mobilization nuclease domain-containing protein [Mucilaginibacter gossypii]